MGRYVLAIFIGGIVFITLLWVGLHIIPSLVLAFFVIGVPVWVMSSKEEPVKEDMIQDYPKHWWRKF